MIRIGNFGGMIDFKSVLNPIKDSHIHRYASNQMREAAKIGLQSLYANPEQVLEKYKDFDIVKAMKERKDSKLLWVRARAIDADKVNTNGDYFSKEELLKETEYKGEKVPAYKTFEGVPIYTNHKNDDIELAKGMVVYAEWDEEENCVYCTFFIDEDAYPDIARGIRQGYMHDVSMGCSVVEGECSICKNVATTESMWCECLKKFKGKKHPENGKLTYEKNRGIKFIELSCVGDGAFDTCEINELYEPDEIISYSENISNKVAKIHTDIAIAATFAPKDLEAKYAYENCLRTISSSANTITRVAQQAGQLVGGQILGIESAAPNATVTKIMEFLGLDPRTGLNILDLLNLSLNFLEVGVMNLFSKKDNIDLGHIGKITKAMADIQTTMQDLIDDGINLGAPQQTVPPPAMQPGQNPQAAPQITTPQQGVGQMISPAAPAPQAPSAPAVPQAGLGGGIGDQSQVWAKTLRGLANIKTALAIEEDLKSDFNLNNIGENNIMAFVYEFQHNYDNKAKVYEVSAPTGEKIVISSNGSVSAYNTNGKQMPFAPALTSEDLELIKHGDIKTASNHVMKRLLKASPYWEDDEASVLQQVNQMDEKAPDEFVNQRLEERRKYNNGEDNDVPTREKVLKDLRVKDYSKTNEERLSTPSWTSRKDADAEKNNMVKEKLLEIARRGVEDKVLEERLEEYRKKSSTPMVEQVEKIIEACAKTAIQYGYHPREIIAAAFDLASDEGTDTLSLAKEVKDSGETVPSLGEDPQASLVDNLADEVDEKTTPADLTSALSSALSDLEQAVQALKNAVDSMSEGESITPSLDETTPTPDEQVKADMALKADSDPAQVGDEDVQAAISSSVNTEDQLGVDTDQVLNNISKMSPEDVTKQIEQQKQPTAIAARKRNFDRLSYYGFNRKASSKDIRKVLFGHLANYALDYNLRSKNLAYALTSMADVPKTTRELIARARKEKQNLRTAEVKIKDTQLNEKTISLSVEDLDGIQVSDPQFQDKLREKVIAILTQSGYSIDPNTFAMNDVFVDGSGCINVKVFTRFERVYSADEVAAPEMGAELGPDEMAQGPMANAMPDMESFETRAAKKQRLLKKYAQALPPMGGGQGLGAMPPAGGAAPAAGAATPPAPGMDLSTATQDIGATTFSANPDEAMGADPMAGGPDASGEVLPGVKKPWGTVCPQCQSLNVEVGNGEGRCNDCGAQLRFEMIVHVSPPSKNEDYKGTLDIKNYNKGEEAVGGEEALEGPISEAGLGGATAPEAASPMTPEAPAPPMGAGAAPAAPAPGGMPGAMPALAQKSKDRVLFRISYVVNPDVYLNGNNNKYASERGTLLPPGFTCPVCASRNTNLGEKGSYCYDCQQLTLVNIEPKLSSPDELMASLTWMI
jgi:hypothetical protein